VKGKRGKAITGIALVTIMLASVFAAMVPTVMAVSVGDSSNHIAANETETVLVGQNVYFDTGWTDYVTIQKFEDGYWYYYGGPWTDGKAYNVNWDPALTLRATDGSGGNTSLAVKDPIVPLKLKVGTKEVSTLTVGTDLKIDTGGINLFDQDKVDLVIICPIGQIISKNNQNFKNITVAELKAFGTSGSNINTTDWKIGDYTFQVKTKSAYACGLSASSDVKELTIIKGEIDISAETTTVTELKTIKLTVTGVSGDEININATPSNKHVLFRGGVEDTPASVTGDNFAHTIDADGKRTYAVKFNDTGTFTIKVTVTDSHGAGRDGEYDTVDITVMNTITGLLDTINNGVTGIMNYLTDVIESKIDDIENKLDNETKFTDDEELASLQNNLTNEINENEAKIDELEAKLHAMNQSIEEKLDCLLLMEASGKVPDCYYNVTGTEPPGHHGDKEKG